MEWTPTKITAQVCYPRVHLRMVNTPCGVRIAHCHSKAALGSGAPEIGRLVADKLRVHYVDREIIAKVAARLEREKQDVIAKEMPPGTLLGRILEALTSGYGGDAFGGAYLPPELIPLAIRAMLRYWNLLFGSWQGDALVIRGRGSQFILKEHPGSLHVLVVAPLEIRVERVMQDLKLDQAAAHEEIARFDTSRHEFIKRYFQAELEDPLQYDLVINTGRLSFEAAVTYYQCLPFKDANRTQKRHKANQKTERIALRMGHPGSLLPSVVQLLPQHLAAPKTQDGPRCYLDLIVCLRVPSLSGLLLSHDEAPQSRDLDVCTLRKACLDDVKKVLDGTRRFRFRKTEIHCAIISIFR